MAEVEYNPKLNTGKVTKGSFSFDFTDIENPISLEIKDTGELAKSFSQLPLIPYATIGNSTSHSLLPWLNSMRILSPTAGACHNRIRDFALGGKLNISTLKDNDFNLETDDDPLDIALQKSFVEFLKTITDEGFSKLSQDVFDELISNGNIFVEIVGADTLGTKVSKIYAHTTEECCYVRTAKLEEKLVAISPNWDETYLRDNPPKVIPLFPNYGVDDDGTKRTILHIKNGNYTWYGRPYWLPCWMYTYREFQDVTYLIKQSKGNFTGQHFMELEDDDVENDDPFDDSDEKKSEHRSPAERMEDNFSNKSPDPQAVLVSTRPYGSRPAFIYSFPANTKEAFYKVTGEISRVKIIENYGWSERLLGAAVGEGFSDAFINDLKTKEVGVLSTIRGLIDKALNIAITELIKFNELTEFEGIGVQHQNISEKLVDTQGSTDVKELFDAYGVGVRAGAITPNADDEAYFRGILAVPDINAATDESWQEDGGYRRPITLKGSEDSESEINRQE